MESGASTPIVDIDSVFCAIAFRMTPDGLGVGIAVGFGVGGAVGGAGGLTSVCLRPSADRCLQRCLRGIEPQTRKLVMKSTMCNSLAVIATKNLQRQSMSRASGELSGSCHTAQDG